MPRIDYTPAPMQPEPHDLARETFWNLPAAKATILEAWIRWALRTSPVCGEVGGSYLDELIELASADCGIILSVDAFKGGLLLSGKYLPTFKTAHLARWKVPAAYIGIPSQKTADFTNLVAMVRP